MSEWKEYKLGELGAFFGGVTTIKREDYGFGTPFITYKNVYKNSKIDISMLELMNVKKNDVIKRNCVYGDIFFTASSETPDEVAMSSVLLENISNLTFNGFCKRFRLHNFDILKPEYARYLLRGEDFRNSAYEYANGDVRFNISQENLAKISIRIPTLPTQTDISEILSSLDDKIELNNKINQELENLAQTLFKRWFIDFEFPNENGEPYKSSGGEMVDSELGEIPKGWNLVKVQDLEHKLQTGTRPKGGVGGITQGVPSIGAESVKKLGYYDFSKVKFVSEEFAAKMKRGKVEGYELLIYKDGGKPGTFIPHFSMFGEGFPFDYFFINEHVFLLDFFNKEFNCFCYFYFDSEYVRPVFENNGGKAAIPGINQEDVRQLWVFNPELERVKLFGQFAHSSVSTILKNCKENIQLTNLRDTLLPKLISGELEVSQFLTNS
jgi:type I restriction enzyme S subunit